MNPTDQRQDYIDRLLRETAERLTGSESLSFAEATASAERGGSFWSFSPQRRGDTTIGGEVVLLRKDDGDDEPVPGAPQWYIHTCGGLFGSSAGVEDSFLPDDDLSEYEGLRFLPLEGEEPLGLMTEYALALVLGRRDTAALD